MRLSDIEVMGIINGIDPFITTRPADLRLYGSRVDDTKKGGDIDLMLKNIGDRKIDLLIFDTLSLESDPFIALTFPSSISLKEWKRAAAYNFAVLQLVCNFSPVLILNLI